MGFSPVIISAIGGAAAVLSVAMVVLVVALMGKLVYDEFIHPRCGGSANNDPLKHSLSLPNQANAGSGDGLGSKGISAANRTKKKSECGKLPAPPTAGGGGIGAVGACVS